MLNIFLYNIVIVIINAIGTYMFMPFTHMQNFIDELRRAQLNRVIELRPRPLSVCLQCLFVIVLLQYPLQETSFAHQILPMMQEDKAELFFKRKSQDLLDFTYGTR